MNPNLSIKGMVDCEGKEVYEGDVVEFLHWCYACQLKWDNLENEAIYKPLYGVVRWNAEYFTYEPLIFATGDFNGNCFATVCQYEPPRYSQGTNKVDYPTAYFKVIGNLVDNPELERTLPMTQMVGMMQGAQEFTHDIGAVITSGDMCTVIGRKEVQ